MLFIVDKMKFLVASTALARALLYWFKETTKNGCLHGHARKKNFLELWNYCRLIAQPLLRRYCKKFSA